MSSFRKATKKQSRLRMALCAPPGGGKTFSALRFATGLVKPGGRICVINTESGAVEKYLGLAPDGIPFDFDIAEMPDFAPTRYTQLIQEAGRDGYDVLIIDSLSHAWAGVGGALELKDKKAGNSNFNSFTAWKDITPMHNAMIEAILRSPCHVIATMRTKVGYVLEEEIDSKTGAKKSVPKKIGMEPVQRQGMEYEFDIVADLDNETHTLKVSKSRCPLVDGAVVVKPGAEFIMPVRQWLEEGVPIDPSYFAVRPEDLKAQQEINQQAVAQQQQAQATEQRRQELLAMAQAGANGNGEQRNDPTAEQPPFDANPPAHPPADDRAAKIAALNELVALGQKIGRTPKQIQDECVAKLGAKPSDLPMDKLQKLIGAFQRAVSAGAATADQSKNQSAA